METRQTQKYCLPVSKAPLLLLGKNQASCGNLRRKRGFVCAQAGMQCETFTLKPTSTKLLTINS